MGFLKSSSCELYFYTENGVQMKCWVKSRKLISYVPQGNNLMFGTIADHLRMEKSDSTAEEMKVVLKIADALEFVENLPEGMILRSARKLQVFRKDRLSVFR